MINSEIHNSVSELTFSISPILGVSNLLNDKPQLIGINKLMIYKLI